MCTLLAGGSSLCVVTVCVLSVTATLPVVLLSSTLCNYYSTSSYSSCYSKCCLCYPCRARPPPASELGCVAAWAGWCHIGFIQCCCFAQTIALSPDHFAGPRRDPCICTRSHGARDHLARFFFWYMPLRKVLRRSHAAAVDAVDAHRGLLTSTTRRTGRRRRRHATRRSVPSDMLRTAEPSQAILRRQSQVTRSAK